MASFFCLSGLFANILVPTTKRNCWTLRIRMVLQETSKRNHRLDTTTMQENNKESRNGEKKTCSFMIICLLIEYNTIQKLFWPFLLFSCIFVISNLGFHLLHCQIIIFVPKLQPFFLLVHRLFVCTDFLSKTLY